ncbi:MAG: LysE family translocator [Gammaproteobacteria bacterium]|nr:LysE family translocator [Gammaproteobacteria bacterium]MBL6998488.1 LysE family translocator [Gammaproteobacteria bacterium]
MHIVDVLSFFIIMLTLALIPSASVALVVTRSATIGVSNGIAVALGIVVGDLGFILLAILGLALLAETMSWLFMLIKYLAAGYLLWLGFRLFSATEKTVITLQKSSQKSNLITSFLAGLFLTLGDIKAIFFYASLFPVLVNLQSVTLPDIVIIMLVTVITVGGVKTMYAFAATKAVLMASGLQLEKGARKVAGLCMLGAGSYLIVKA